MLVFKLLFPGFLTFLAVLIPGHGQIENIKDANELQSHVTELLQPYK